MRVRVVSQVEGKMNRKGRFLSLVRADALCRPSGLAKSEAPSHKDSSSARVFLIGSSDSSFLGRGGGGRRPQTDSTRTGEEVNRGSGERQAAGRKNGGLRGDEQMNM